MILVDLFEFFEVYVCVEQHDDQTVTMWAAYSLRRGVNNGWMDAGPSCVLSI